MLITHQSFITSPNSLIGLRIQNGQTRSSQIRCSRRRFPHVITAAVAAPPREMTSASAGAATLYGVLGIQAAATSREIKAAYRRRARECHPDVVAAEKRFESAGEFIRIHDAYATLSDPDKRARYDRDVLAIAVAKRQQWSPEANIRYPRRTWETEQCW